MAGAAVVDRVRRGDIVIGAVEVSQVCGAKELVQKRSFLFLERLRARAHTAKMLLIYLAASLDLSARQDTYNRNARTCEQQAARRVLVCS